MPPRAVLNIFIEARRLVEMLVQGTSSPDISA